MFILNWIKNWINKRDGLSLAETICFALFFLLLFGSCAYFISRP
jgi:hypothetical protein